MARDLANALKAEGCRPVAIEPPFLRDGGGYGATITVARTDLPATGSCPRKSAGAADLLALHPVEACILV